MGTRLTVSSDGGSRGNPGPAGTGSVVRSETGEELGLTWSFIDNATNNVAEYHGLINGLKLAKEICHDLGEDPVHTDIDVRMDSKLIVEQMNGRWKIKHPDMKPLAAQVKQLQSQFHSMSYTWVPRKENARADELANRAMDTKAGGTDKHVASKDASSNRAAPSSTATSSTAASAEPRQTPPTPDNAARTESTEQPQAPSWLGTQRPLRLLLLRHGETRFGYEGRFCGHSDPELTREGLWQARRAAHFLSQRGGISAIYSSPLKRAEVTARIVAEQLGVHNPTQTPSLTEMDFGDWEGKKFDEVSPNDDRGGEDPERVFERTGTLVDELLKTKVGENVLLVSHVTPIKSILRRALGMDATIYHRLHLDLASLSIAEFYPDGRSLVRGVNDTHYLR